MAEQRTDDSHQYDHSEHPTTHVKPEDEQPPSHAKVDDSAEHRGNQRHPSQGSQPSSLDAPDS